MRSMLPLLLLLTLAGPALATDGLLEINQACAVQTGCFAGDTPGFPVQVNAAGGYRLTSDLVVPDENTTGILVVVSSVQVDLNGFEITRSSCQAATSNCTPTSGSGYGVYAPDLDRARGVVVRNGSITGMGSYGVLLGPQSEVTHLRLRWNRVGGIRISNHSKVSDNLAFENGGSGIFEIIGSTGTGGSVISGNTAYGNGGNGIRVVSGSIAHGNTIRANSLLGLSFSSFAYYTNTLTLNTGGAVSGGQNLGRNSCNGAPSCP